MDAFDPLPRPGEGGPVGSPADGWPADWFWLGRLCQRIVRDPGLADDAQQEVWLAAVAREDGLEGEAPDRKTLGLLLRRFLWRSRRADGRRAVRESMVAQRAEWPATDELVGRAEQQQRVLRALLELDEPYRSTLLGQFQEGLTPGEIASQSGVPVDTVRWRLRRGIERLKGALQRDVEGGGLAAVALGIPAGLVPFAPAVSVTSVTPLGAAAAAPTKVVSVAAASAAGALMSKGIAIGLTALALVIGFFLVRPSGDGENLGGALPNAGRPGAVNAEPAPGRTNADLAVVPEAVERVAPKAPPAVRSPEAPVDPSTIARFEGLVVRGDGAAIENAEVRGWAYKRFEESSSSDSDGAFVLDVPCDPVLGGELTVAAGPFLTQVKQRFGPGRRGRPLGPLRPLSAGIVDVGRVVLAPAGVVTGRIVDPGGRGIGQGWIGAGNAPSVEPGADGSFTIPHVEVGTVVLDVIARGMLDLEMEIEVMAGQTTDLGTLRLSAGGRISGRVTDGDGLPVPGAEVSSRAFTRAWCFKVNEDGTFDIPMPSLEPCDVYARADGFEQWDDLTVEPGAKDVHIVLGSEGERCSFLVVDGKTGDPVPSFGVSFEQNAGSKAVENQRFFGPQEPDVRRWKGGKFALVGRPGLDAVMIWAPGYKRSEVTIADNAGAVTQVITLHGASALRGRIVSRSGQGLEGVEVTMFRGSAARFRDVETGKSSPFGPEDPRRRGLGGYTIPKVKGIDLPLPPVSFVNGRGFSTRKATTGPGGVFSFGDCNGGLCALYAGHAGEKLWTPLLAVSKSGDTDLGDLRLAEPSTLSGRLALGIDAPLDGHRVFVELPEKREVLTDGAGAFTFSGVPAGDHVIRVALTEDVYEALDDKVFGYSMSIGPGAAREVVLPMRTEPSAELVLLLTHNGAPLAEHDVTFWGPQGQRAGRVETDGSGRTQLRLPFGVEFGWRVSMDGGDLAGSQSVTLSEGSNERTLELSSGALELFLPVGLELPQYSRAEIYRGGSVVDDELVSTIEIERVVEAQPQGSVRAIFDALPVTGPGLPGEQLTVVVSVGHGRNEGDVLLERTFQAKLVAGQVTEVKL